MTTAAIDYLRSYEFKPHLLGNAKLYGLNATECDSTIWFKPDPVDQSFKPDPVDQSFKPDQRDQDQEIPKEEIWRFVSFNSHAALFTNVHGKTLELPLEYNDAITRLQIRPPEYLDPAVEDYLLEFEAYANSMDPEEIESPVLTEEVAELIKKTGYTANELMSVLDFYEPDIDGIGEARGGGYFFDLDNLC